MQRPVEATAIRQTDAPYATAEWISARRPGLESVGIEVHGGHLDGGRVIGEDDSKGIVAVRVAVVGEAAFGRDARCAIDPVMGGCGIPGDRHGHGRGPKCGAIGSLAYGGYGGGACAWPE